MQEIKKSFVLWFTVLLVIFAAGCSGGGSSGTQQGTLSVSLTDATASGFDHVYVTVQKVRVHQSVSATENDGGWSDITLQPARKIDLLTLTNGVLENLGQTSLPAGHYTQLRLVLSSNLTGTVPANSVVLSGDTNEIPLETPSAVQSGIKLINEFDVAPGQRVDLVLDFDALKSVVKRGNSPNAKYALKPVIHIIPSVLTGIGGFVDKALLNNNVMVSSQVSGTVFRSTVPNTDGGFFLSHLAAGDYDVVITADDHATAVIAGVPVSAATSTAIVTMVSTSAVPISLPTSTMQTISGTLATNPTSSTTAIAYVATKQTFTGGGPTVTVKSQAADLPGSYSLALPAAAPVLGQYDSGSLPILFTAPSGSGGLYDIEVSAAGYQTGTGSVDISIADVIKDFTLTPVP